MCTAPLPPPPPHRLQLPTRRFVHAVLEDRAILVKSYMAPLYAHPAGRLFVQLVDLLRFYVSFPIHDHTGDPLRWAHGVGAEWVHGRCSGGRRVGHGVGAEWYIGQQTALPCPQACSALGLEPTRHSSQPTPTLR